MCGSPFLFGAVDRDVWFPLCLLWLSLGLLSNAPFVRDRAQREAGVALSRALLPLHALIALQLLPLPRSILQLASPGSFAVHFLPDPGDVRLRPISVAPGATIEAWLYFAGLQGLALALCGIPVRMRVRAQHIVLASLTLLAVEGLWQSRSDHPYLLYSLVPTFAPLGLETAIFGPYYNRNHFATMTATGSALAAALAASRAARSRPLLSDSPALAYVVLLLGASGVLGLATLASGSRSGCLAAVVGVGYVAARFIRFRTLMLAASLLFLPVLWSGAAAVERLAKLDPVASRWSAWRDMAPVLRFFPIFGSGLGTFGRAYLPYQANAPYEIWTHAHNEYLQYLIEGGIAGLIAVLWVVVGFGRRVGAGRSSFEPVNGAGVAFATQALLDFPGRIPANAACVVALFSLAFAARDSGKTPLASQSPGPRTRPIPA